MTTVILVIDGFGVGAMPDAGDLRPEDIDADTVGHIAQSRADSGRPWRLPWLSRAGLTALRPDLTSLLDIDLPDTDTSHLLATARRSALGYPGADTFAGHQTMMGADMSHVVLRRVGDDLDSLRSALESSGHEVELLHGHLPLLVVDGVALVHDNLEADPALNWNVSARLDEMPWEQVLAIAQIVRKVAPVARVIAVGGISDRPLPASVREGPAGTIGLDTPLSGFYTLGGLRVQHLGADVDHRHQLPQLAAERGIPVTLVGKASDLLEIDDECSANVVRLPGIDTGDALRHTLDGIKRGGLVITNIQQTDLAGHQQDTDAYASRVEQVDAAIPEMIDCIDVGGRLIITGDHGNDPTIGHAYHTREFTPVLSISGGIRSNLQPVVKPEEFKSLADIGASVAAVLGLDPRHLENGTAHNL
jgi:phosphopentomutase